MQTAASSKEFAKYNILVLAMSFTTLLILIFFIIQATDDYKDGHVFVEKALHWQSRTKGTVALPGKHLDPFKRLSQKVFLEENRVNSLVLGSSTVMGIRHEMFPKDWTVYNFSKSDQRLRETIGEAYYFIERYEDIQWIVIGLDYRLGRTFGEQDVEEYHPYEARKTIEFSDKFFDAITLNRLKITLRNVWSNLNRNNEEYLCPENDGKGRDFGDVMAPGECWGYRYDGSATFKYHKMSKAEWKSMLNEKSLGLFVWNLKKLAGQVNQNQLDHLKAINDLLEKRSGGLVLISPPTMPGVEKLLFASSAGKYLQEYNEKLKRWTFVNKIKFIDAGASEEYGCTLDEFYDPHHALDHCYFKIFDKFFKKNKDVF